MAATSSSFSSTSAKRFPEDRQDGLEPKRHCEPGPDCLKLYQKIILSDTFKSHIPLSNLQPVIDSIVSETELLEMFRRYSLDKISNSFRTLCYTVDVSRYQLTLASRVLKAVHGIANTPDCTNLFYQIIYSETFASTSPRLQIKPLIEILSCNHETLQLFQQHSILKIKACFRKLCTEAHLSKNRSQYVSGVLNGIYYSALVNSPIAQRLIDANKDLPALVEKTGISFTVNLHDTLDRGRSLIQKLQMGTVSEPLKEINDAIRDLESFRSLKIYLDKDEVRRLLDLARAIKKQNNWPQYPDFLDSFPQVAERIYVHRSRIGATGKLLQELISEKIKLQQEKAAASSVSSSTTGLSDQFLLSFATPLYSASAKILWKLLFAAKEEERVKNLPHFASANEEECDTARLNAFCTQLYPDFDIEEWICKMLARGPQEARDLLAGRLQELSAAIERVRLDREMDPVVKAHSRKVLSDESEQICFAFLQERATTIFEIEN